MVTEKALDLALSMERQTQMVYGLVKSAIYLLIHSKSAEMLSLKEESEEIPNAFGAFASGEIFCPTAIGKIVLVRAQGDSNNPNISYVMLTNDDCEEEDKLRDMLLTKDCFNAKETEEIYDKYKPYFFDLDGVATLFPHDTALSILKTLQEVVKTL